MPKKSVLPILIAIFVFVAVFCIPFPEKGNSPVTVTPENPAVMGSESSCEVFFTNPGPGNIDERSPEAGLIELIGSAEKTIDMAVFEFDLDSVKDALAEAWARGVEIRVVYDNEYTDKDLDMKELLSLGIKGTPDERSALMHNKFFIVDRKTVWTGSFNVSENAAHKNNENAMRIESEKLAEYYTEEFERMFSGEFGPKKDDENYPPVTVCGGAPAEVYFAPDGPKEAILESLAPATESIYIMAFSFTDDEIGNLVISKAKTLDVGAVFENRGSGTEYSEFARITKNSDGCTDANKGTFHHKVIIIDGKTVIFGSYNFSASAEEDNDENMLIIESAEIAAKFEEEYKRRFNEAEASGLCTIN